MQATAYGLELYTQMHIATRLMEAAHERQARRAAPTPRTPRGGASALRIRGRALLARIEQALWGTESSELSMDCFPRTCC